MMRRPLSDPRLHRRAFVASGLALAACAPKAESQPPISIRPLKAAAPFPVGSCIQAAQLDDPAMAALYAAQVNQLTPEWELKMEYVVLPDGTYRFRRARPHRRLRRRQRHAVLRPHPGLVL